MKPLPMPTDRMRAAYNNLIKEYSKKITITQGYLRLETPLTSSLNRISFKMLVNDGSVRNSEKRLALTDVFYATEMSLNIYKVTDADELLTPWGSTLDTFPNSITYGAANESRALQYLYNGNTNIKINNNVIIEGLDNMRFYRAGMAQEGVEVSTGATNPAYIADEWDTASYGFFPLTPNILFSGTAKNDVFIELPDAVDMSGTTSTNYAVMVFRGLLIQNASDFYKGVQSDPGRF